VSDLHVDGISKEGDGVGRGPDGRVVFVPGALPGEEVEVEVETERKSYSRARLVDVVSARDGRIAPRCPHVGAGCGGCDFQHAQPGLQHELKVRIVTEALERIGKMSDPPVVFGGAVPDWAYRTTVRAAVEDGRAGFRRRSSHDLVSVDECFTAHPVVSNVLVAGRFPSASEVQIRLGSATGDCLVSVWGSVEDVVVPDGIRVSSIDSDASIHEEVAGRSWQVSGRSFFQSSREGAELLVDAVRLAVGDDPRSRGALIDLYSGVGLLAGSLGEWGRIVAVESSASAISDARQNLGDGAELVRSRVERWRPSRGDVVVADPARSGLGAVGVEKVTATGARRVVLVSCDAAAGARDLALLRAEGYGLERVSVLDLFPQTSHVEMVSALSR
jgi:23S rRNA (uracil1939-C5)-methyltransferase